MSKEKKRKLLIYFLFYLFTIISSVGAVILYIKYFPSESKVITETINKTMVSEKGIEKAITDVYDAVVTVSSYADGSLAGTGSGFIYKTDDKYGYIITNNHVVTESNGYKIILQNGKEVEAKLLGADEYSDLAVLRIDKENVIKVANLGDSDLIEIGNTVFTVGSPMGSEYSGSVTRGVISGKDRTVESDEIVTKVIQTDAAINPGNSGGPLVNLAGEVIGITSMKLASSAIEGMGFAIPINDAKVFVQKLEKGEKISRPVLGAYFINAEEKYKLFYYGINIDRSITSGTVVGGLQRGGSLEDAGLKIGDVIVKIDNKNVDTLSRLRYYLYQYNIGDKVKITYIRGTKEYTAEVKLESN